MSMCAQSLNCLKSMYLLIFSPRRVSRHPGTDLTSGYQKCLVVDLHSSRSLAAVLQSPLPLPSFS